jgi:hypothetical protein
MSRVSRDDNDNQCRQHGDASSIQCSESLVGIYYVADCDDEDDLDHPNVRSVYVAEQRGIGTTTTTTTTEYDSGITKNSNDKKQQCAIVTPNKNYLQMEQEIAAKRQGRGRTNGTMVKRTKHQPSPMKVDNGTQDRTLRLPDIDDMRKSNERKEECKSLECKQLEHHVDRKLNSMAVESTRARALQNDIDAKRFARTGSRRSTTSVEILRLDERIAARSSKIRLASKRNVLQTNVDEQDSPTMNIMSNLGTAKNEGGTLDVNYIQRSDSVTAENMQSAKIGTDKVEINPGSAMYQESSLDYTSYELIPSDRNSSDLEYGAYDGKTTNESGLAVAMAVHEDEEDAYLPSAIEFDPDAKPPAYKNRRFRLYACLAIIVVIVGTVTASVGITLTQDVYVEPIVELPYRATLGIRENIERIVGGEKLADLNSPYRKALDWIQDVDPLTLTPNDSNFLQRYLAVYFFYATTTKNPWTGGCNPPIAGEDESCVYKRLSSLDPVTYTDIPWKRWLTKQFECNWAGIYCDDAGAIRSLEFSTLIITILPLALVN